MNSEWPSITTNNPLNNCSSYQKKSPLSHLSGPSHTSVNMPNERTASVSQMIPDSFDIDLLTAEASNMNTSTSTSSASISSSTINHNNHSKNATKLAAPSALSGVTSEALLNSVAAASTQPTSEMLSPPGSRYAFESEIPHSIVSPILSSVTSDNYGNVFSNAALSIQRPLSVQDVSVPGISLSNDGFDNFRSFSAQGPVPPSTAGNSAVTMNGLNVESIERPLSSMETDSTTFKNDVANLINWVNTLNSNQLRAMIDNLLPSLSDEILNYTKSKLAGFQFHNNQDGMHTHHHVPVVASPVPMYQVHQQHEPVNLDSVLNDSIHSPASPQNQHPHHHHQQQQQQQQHHHHHHHNQQQPQNQQAGPWSPPMHNLQRALSPPNFPSFDRAALLQDASFNRPRSADPYSSKLVNNVRELNRTSSKTRLSQQQRFDQHQQQPQQGHQQQANSNSGNANGAFDITNLAQQLTQTQINVNDFNNPNLLKLSALSTINNRAQLDFNKKRIVSPTAIHQPVPQQGTVNKPTTSMMHSQSQITPGSKPYYQQYDSINSQMMNRGASANTPQLHNHHHSNNGKITASSTIIKQTEFQTPIKPNTTANQLQQQQQQQQQQSSTPKSPAIDSTLLCSPQLLSNIPSWLKTLRLHKYTNVLGDIPWRELIYMDDAELEKRGVSAMGARGKLRKAFEVVKGAVERGEI